MKPPVPITAACLVMAVAYMGARPQGLTPPSADDPPIIQEPGATEEADWLDVPSEVMPAESVPQIQMIVPEADAAPPRGGRGKWVDPDTVGSQAPYAKVVMSHWGFGIGGKDGLPTVLDSHSLSGKGNAITYTGYDGAGGPLQWTQTRTHGYPEIFTKWGLRAYDANNWIWRQCTWDSIRVEHGCYMDPIGPLRWEECYFGGEGGEEINGQGIQVVYAWPGTTRAHETGIKDPQAYKRLFAMSARQDLHQVIRCAFVEVGKPYKSDRASFAISFFEPHGPNGPIAQAVEVIQCWMRTSDPWIDSNGATRDCAGAIMVHKRKQVKILSTYIEYRLGDRDVIQLWGNGDGVPDTPDVILAGNHVLASQAIDIRLGNPNDTVILRGNTGTAQVVISTNDWYVWKEPGWQESKVLYRGPVSADYRLN